MISLAVRLVATKSRSATIVCLSVLIFIMFIVYVLIFIFFCLSCKDSHFC